MMDWETKDETPRITLASGDGEFKAPTTTIASEEAGSSKADSSDEIIPIDKAIERSVKLKLDLK